MPVNALFGLGADVLHSDPLSLCVFHEVVTQQGARYNATFLNLGRILSKSQGLLERTAQTQTYFWKFSALEVLFLFLLKCNKNI